MTADTWCVLSTGPSMSQSVADSVRHLPRVAVNLSYQLAPDAQALAASDMQFWHDYPEAHQFAGRKFTTARAVRGVQRIEGMQHGTCSGVVALEAAKILGATEIILLGMDFSGSHYFGQYKRQSSDNDIWVNHRSQFKHWAKCNPSIRVVNCTTGSKLDVFELGDIRAYTGSMPAAS